MPRWKEIMIRVTVKAHATLKEVFGQNNLIISVPEGSTVGEVLDRAIGRFQEDLEQRYGLQRAQELLQHCILLLNGIYYLRSDALRASVKEGDQIEIMQTLAGG
jgi:molybdopterin converting factor small subunit